MNARVKAASAALAVVGAVSATTAALVAPAAVADTVHNLPSQTQRYTMGDGTVVSFTRIREKAVVNPSMGGTPLHRNAWVSGKLAVRTSKKADFEIYPGYIVGCQVNLGGATGEGGAEAGNIGPEPELGGEVGGSLELGPGQARSFYLVDREKADDFGNEKHEKKIAYKKSMRGTLSYTNSQLSLRGCAGYAQARSFATVYVETDRASQYMSFYGRPFSLG